MATDRLTLAQAFRATGMEREQADRIAITIFDAIHDQIDTLKSEASRQKIRLDTRLSWFDEPTLVFGAIAVFFFGLILGLARHAH